jgi:hypothetical protein
MLRHHDLCHRAVAVGEEIVDPDDAFQTTLVIGHEYGVGAVED